MIGSGAHPISGPIDRKSTRLNSSHRCISYAVFCLKKKEPQFFLFRAEHQPSRHGMAKRRSMDGADPPMLAVGAAAASLSFLISDKNRFFFKELGKPRLLPPFPPPGLSV